MRSEPISGRCLFISNAFAKQTSLGYLCHQFALRSVTSDCALSVAIVEQQRRLSPPSFLAALHKMSDLCPVYAPFFGAMVSAYKEPFWQPMLKRAIGLHFCDRVHL